jgi:hypothetical protein
MGTQRSCCGQLREELALVDGLCARRELNPHTREGTRT